MLWLPSKHTFKQLRKQNRRTRRQRISRFILFLLLLFGLGAATVPPNSAIGPVISQVTAPYQFDFVAWETKALAGEAGRRLTPPNIPDTLDAQRTLVQRFLDLEADARDLKRQLNLADTSIEQDLEAEIARIKASQAEIIPQVETILTYQVETILREEGFTWQGQVFTPLAFRFIDPPTALIISPRDQIVREHFVGLAPGLDTSIRGDIEATLDNRGDVSSYVTNIGGLGSYPTMVINYPFLPWLVEVIAHEWTHNYLYSFPTNISWGYSTYPRLRTINETTADIVGKEISRKVITRFYPDWIEHLPPLDETGLPAVSEPSEFHLAMREIRLTVDELLAEGRTEEAETYMEQERLKLVKLGYNLRKLNQAYFAFHGSYALSPASVDPTGSQLQALRSQSDSLKAFVDQVGQLNSYNQFSQWLAQAEIDK